MVFVRGHLWAPHLRIRLSVKSVSLSLAMHPLLLNALRLLCLLCRGLHGAFVLVLSAPTCSEPCAVDWNTCTRHFCCSVTPLFLSVLVQSAPSTSSAASGRCSRISPSRGLVEGLVLLRALSVGDSCARHLRSFSTLWFRRVSAVAVASLRLLQAPPCVETSMPPLRLLTWLPAS